MTTSKSMTRAVIRLATWLLTMLLAVSAFSGTVAFADDSVASLQSHAVVCYREAQYGTAPNGTESSDGMHVQVTLVFEGEVVISDEEALIESLNVLLNGSENEEGFTVAAEGDTLVLDLPISYALFYGRVTVGSVNSSGLLDGISVDGLAVCLEEFTTLADTGLEFEAIEIIEGTDDTPASTTFQVTQSAVVRSMNHIVWLTTSSSDDGTGASIITNSGGYSQSTVAHHHNFWSFTAADSADYIVSGAASELADYGYTLTDNGDGTFTITADTAVAGEVLWATTYTDSFFNATGLAYEEDVVGVAMPDADSHDYDYDDVVWSWSSDYSSATATIVCANDANHTLSVEATVSAVANANGTSTFVATATFEEGVVRTSYVTLTSANSLVVAVDDMEVCFLYAADCAIVGDEGSTYAAALRVKDDGSYEISVEYGGQTYSAQVDDLEGTIELSDELSLEVDVTTISVTSSSHVLEAVDAEEETCTEEGSIAHYVCTVCGRLFADETATEELTDDEVAIAALGHDYVASGTATATCTEGVTVTYVCSRCGDSYTKDIAALGHNYEVVETVDATCTEPGSIMSVCTNCADVQTETIDALGHTYVGSWAWGLGYNSASVTLTCSTCGDVQADLVASVVSSSTTQGTTTLTTYTATVTYEGETYSAEIVVSTESAEEEEDDEVAYDYFDDVTDASKYWYEAVYQVAHLGYMTGKTSTHFGASDALTRAQMVTIVWRIACPEEYASYENDAVNETGMDDVLDNKYYTAAVNWAVAEGVITGKVAADGTNYFDPNGACTFEQFCTILARYLAGGDDALEAAVTSEEAEGVLASFSDASNVSAYARKAVAYVVSGGAVDGKANGTLAPKETVARYRCVTVIYKAVVAGLL